MKLINYLLIIIIFSFTTSHSDNQIKFYEWKKNFKKIALQNNNNVYILDGDGAMIMHMGSLATIGHYHPKNLTHIIFDNNSHESTGGQPTVSETIDIPSVLKACNYQNVSYIKLESELSEILKLNNDNLKGLVIQTKKGSRDDLGRPTDSPQKTKVRFMEEIANGK